MERQRPRQRQGERETRRDRDEEGRVYGKNKRRLGTDAGE